MLPTIDAPSIASRPDTDGQRSIAYALAFLCVTLGVVSAAEIRVFSLRVHIPWSQALGITMPRWTLLALTAPVLLSIARRFPLFPIRSRTIAVHTIAFCLLAAANAIVYTAASRRWGPAPPGYTPVVHLARSFVSSLPVVVLTFGASLAAARTLDLLAERKARDAHAARLESQLATARLVMLRAQMQPHFLYNTLHGIAALVADNRQPEALDSLERLADLLHDSLHDGNRQLITLGEELDLTRQFLELQQMRFPDRLIIAEQVEPRLRSVLVPAFVLQPLVENAVRHGLTDVTSMRLTIGGSTDDGSLDLVVANDGVVLPDTWGAHSPRGIGVPNIRARLRELYGTAASLHVDRRPEGGVLARVRVPLRYETHA